MTEKLYLSDSYLKELTAKVTAIDGNSIKLDKTIFYPAGGGQPSDYGTIEVEGKNYNVTDVKKEGDDVVHVVSEQPSFSVGSEAKCVIDWKRRYSLMRYHTAVHIIDGIIEKRHNNGTITGGQLYVDRAHFDLDLQSLNREMAQQIIVESQQVIDEGHEIKPKMLKKEEALKIDKLVRTAPGEELLKNMENVRLLEIIGFDIQMDGGTHVANTKEVGKLILSKFENKGSHRKRIEIKLE